MSRYNPSPRLRHRVVSIALLLAMAVPFIGAHRAAAGTRLADAASPPVTVHYHLVAVLTAGPSAGAALDGGVAGMLDSTGVLTATVVTALGQMSTITGTLQGSGSSLALLTLHNAAGTWHLRGTANKAGVLAGAVSATGSSGAVGAWAMTPETAAHTYAFVAKVTTGPDSGTVESGTLATFVTSATADSFDAAYYGDDGSAYTAAGRVVNHTLEVLLNVKGLGVAIGSALQKEETVLGTSYTTFSGAFAGPASGDAGQWSASQTS